MHVMWASTSRKQVPRRFCPVILPIGDSSRVSIQALVEGGDENFRERSQQVKYESKGNLEKHGEQVSNDLRALDQSYADFPRSSRSLAIPSSSTLAEASLLYHRFCTGQDVFEDRSLGILQALLDPSEDLVHHEDHQNTRESWSEGLGLPSSSTTNPEFNLAGYELDDSSPVCVSEPTRKHEVCEHGKQRYRCISCGGIGICRHGRRKERCKDCGGSSICEHGKEKYVCEDCSGGGICKHGIRKRRCQDCGGSAMCMHGKYKHRCKDCGGRSICGHGREKYRCKDCGGRGICEHGKQRHTCKVCGGNSFCVHGKRKDACKDCGGSSICRHGRRIQMCVQCGGSSICRHGKRRYRCKECKGSSICSHGLRRERCKACEADSENAAACASMAESRLWCTPLCNEMFPLYFVGQGY